MPQQRTAKITGANTTYDATGSNVYELLRATRKIYVERVSFQPAGTNSATAVRVFLNTAEPIDLASNNKLIAEGTVSSTGSQTAGSAAVDVTIDDYLQEGERLLVTAGTAPTGGIHAKAVYSDHYSDFNV